MPHAISIRYTGEIAGGKGFADMVFLPTEKFPDKPALVIELKWDHSAQQSRRLNKNNIVKA